ncbi:hypothetical protein BH09SUM1_BH09SUM1_27370 [soil metagenome]
MKHQELSEYIIGTLKEPERCRQYLDGAFEDYEVDGDYAGLLLAVRRVAEARMRIDANQGIKNSEIDRVLAIVSSKQAPSFDQLLSTVRILGWRLSLVELAS